MNDVRMIGIAGGSGSGKSSLAQALARKLDHASTFSMDHFYLPRPLAIQREDYDFDAPQAMDFQAIINTLATLKAGQAADIPVWDFNLSMAMGWQKILPAPWVIVEGLHLLHDPLLRTMMDHTFFIDASAEIMLARRMLRDIHERGRTPEHVIQQYFNHVLPAYHTHILPGRSHADYIVDNPYGAKLEERVNILWQTILSPSKNQENHPWTDVISS